MKDEEKKIRADRFAFDPVTPDEVGSVKDADGKERKAGQKGFLEALAEQAGFEIEDLTN